MPIESFFFGARPVVYVVCVLKLAITITVLVPRLITVCAEKASQPSLNGVLELVNPVLTDGMLAIFAFRALFQPVCLQGTCPHRGNRMRTSKSSSSSTISRASGRSDASTRNLSSTRTKSSGVSRISIESATTSVIDRRTRISLPMEQFLLTRDYGFETTLGTLEGNFGALNGPPMLAG